MENEEINNAKKNSLVCMQHFRDGINQPLYEMGFSVAEHCYLDGVLRDLETGRIPLPSEIWRFLYE
jgi:hypothetical protein